MESAQTWGTNLVRREQLLSSNAVMAMTPGARVNLVVTTEDGKPLAGAAVHLIKGDEPAEPHKTDANGRASIYLLDDHDWKAAVIARGFAPSLIAVNAVAAAAPVSVKLAEGKLLKGRVVDLQPKPISGATVALKSWQGTSLLDWKTETDSDGWFQWNGAPHSAMQLSIRKEGYRDVTNHPAVAGESNAPVTLVKIFTVTGLVVDADTQQPVPAFKIYKGRKYTKNEAVRWDGDYPVAGSDGGFSLELSRIGPEQAVLVEAEGYLPVASPVYDQPDAYTNRFQLKKGSGISGVVHWPDGTPAPGVTMALLDTATSAYMDQPGEFRTNASRNPLITTTDQQGRFEFLPRISPHTIFAMHNDGFAELRVPAVIESGRVILQPWGRVKGVLRVHDTGETNLTIALHTMRYRYAEEGRTFPPLSLYLKVVPDEHGNFLFEKVPPGARKVYLQYKFFEGAGTVPLSHGVILDVKAGETAEVVIGGTGRTITGKVSAGDREIDWRRHVQRFSLKVPDPDFGRPPPTKPATPEARERALADFEARSPAFWTSKKGRAIERSQMSYVPVFSKDGSFRIPNVPAGRYEFAVEVREPIAASHRMIGSVRKDIVVPEGAEPLDIGAFHLVLTAPRRPPARAE